MNYHLNSSFLKTSNQYQNIHLNQAQHMNPSKSKVNLRTSMTKNDSLNSSVIKFRNSGMYNPPMNSSSSNNRIENYRPQSQLFKASVKQNIPVHNQKQNIRYSQIVGSSSFLNKQRKSQSFSNTFNKEEVQSKNSENYDVDGIKSQIACLFRKVQKNQLQIKEFKSQLPKLVQQQTKVHIMNKQYYESKNNIIEKNKQFIEEMKLKIQAISPEIINSKINCIDIKVNDLFNGFMTLEKKHTEKPEYNSIALEKRINEETQKRFENIKMILNADKINSVGIQNKLVNIEKILQCNSLFQFKKTNKYCVNPLVLHAKSLLCLDSNTITNSIKTNKQPIITQSTLLTKAEIYYIDPSGYLLDDKKFYLVNSQNEQIKLNSEAFSILKTQGLLKSLKMI